MTQCHGCCVFIVHSTSKLKLDATGSDGMRAEIRLTLPVARCIWGLVAVVAWRQHHWNASELEMPLAMHYFKLRQAARQPECSGTVSRPCAPDPSKVVYADGARGRFSARKDYLRQHPCAARSGFWQHCVRPRRRSRPENDIKVGACREDSPVPRNARNSIDHRLQCCVARSCSHRPLANLRRPSAVAPQSSRLGAHCMTKGNWWPILARSAASGSNPLTHYFQPPH